MVRRTHKRRKSCHKMGGRIIKGRRRLTRRSSRSRSRKLGGGGVRFGTGIGSNCNDPNQSIFNTNLLKLFPYKPERII
jgi:hypothetical protein